MSDPLTCPTCGYTMPAPAAQIRDVAICASPTCGASFVPAPADGPTRRATAADLAHFTLDEITTLRTSRKRTR